MLLNGNNVGWWGNQFVIRRKQLRFKPKGPIFDDGDLPAHVSGHHAFFLHGSLGFQIVDIQLHGTTRAAGDTNEMDLRAYADLPRCGLSGFPLIRHGKTVWEHERGEGLGPRSPVRPRRLPPGHPPGHPGVRPDADRCR